MSLSVPILVAGAINTDLVASMRRAPEAGETITGTSFAIHGGGKGGNQAVAIARSGGDVHLVGSIGNDDFGRARLADLKREGADTGWVRVNDQVASGVALIFVEDGGENRIAYVPGATRTVPAAHAAAACHAVTPSFVLAPNELPHDSLVLLFRAARAIDARVIFNATPDPESASDLLEWVSVLIVNQIEARTLLEVDSMPDPLAAVTQLMGAGPETVILTVGKDGAWIGDRNGVDQYRPPPVEVIDTTGAGDTFCGAFTAELATGATTRDSVKYAVTASALSVTKPGAQSSIPTRAEVEASSD